MWSLKDEPALRSSFMSVSILEHPPDFERLRRRMVQAVAGLEILRLRVVPGPLDLGCR